MSTLITTCRECGRAREVSVDTRWTVCPRCGCQYHIWDEELVDETDPDYGGAFDGHTVHSDADPGL